jgi:hypothetical protein
LRSLCCKQSCEAWLLAPDGVGLGVTFIEIMGGACIEAAMKCPSI